MTSHFRHYYCPFQLPDNWRRPKGGHTPPASETFATSCPHLAWSCWGQGSSPEPTFMVNIIAAKHGARSYWISFIHTHSQANADLCRNDMDINVFWMEYLQAADLQSASKVQLLQSVVSVHLSYIEEKCHTTMWSCHSCRFRNACYWFWQHNITLAVHVHATHGSDSIKYSIAETFKEHMSSL